MSSSIISISYEDLISASKSCQEKVAELVGQGFGQSAQALGIIAITDIPNYSNLRNDLLKLSHQLATETHPDVLHKMTNPESHYQVGWSHGKEKLEGGKLDTSKGSFYANPLTDNPLGDILARDYSLSCKKEDRDAFCTLAEKNPAFYAANVWPDEDLPQLRKVFKEMGKLIHDIGCMVGKHADNYVKTVCPDYEPQIEKTIQNSLCCKGRLLHYFPPPSTIDHTKENTSNDDTDMDYSSWCGWHNDHCSLTGLLPAMYIDANGNEISNPDPDSGLYIKARDGRLVRASIPSNAMAFQIGETAQIHSGGILQATPHAVRGCTKDGCQGVSRESFAVFMEPEYFGEMRIPYGKTIQDAQRKEDEIHLPKSVKTLRSRYKEGMNFGEFSEATFAAFH